MLFICLFHYLVRLKHFSHVHGKSYLMVNMFTAWQSCILPQYLEMLACILNVFLLLRLLWKAQLSRKTPATWSWMTSPWLQPVRHRQTRSFLERTSSPHPHHCVPRASFSATTAIATTPSSLATLWMTVEMGRMKNSAVSKCCSYFYLYFY